MVGETLAEAVELKQTPMQPPEAYAKSASKWRQMGAVPVAHEVEVGDPEIARRQALADCISSLVEMIKTDEEFGKFLVIKGNNTFDTKDGQVIDIDGKPMVNMVKEGSRISTALALTEGNEDYAGQAERDRNDVKIAERVDALKPGESLFVLSMVPKADMKKYFKTYFGLGYREGLSYWQYYSKTHDGKVVAGWHSIDESNEAALRELFAEEGVEIPAGEDHNRWILHGIEREMLPEEAEAFTARLVERYNQKAGLPTHKLSASEFVEVNRPIVEHIFQAYYPALGRAIFTGRNNETMRSFAAAMLKTDLEDMNTDARSQLVKIANSQKFDDELGRTMESVIRYAIVEELRKGLGKLISQTSPSSANAPVSADYANDYHIEFAPGNSVPEQDVHALNAMMAGNVSYGIKEGHKYGGCANVDLNKENVFDVKAAAGNAIDAAKGARQEAFGGYGKNEKDNVGEEKLGKCRIKVCPNADRVVRVGGCNICLEICQPIFNEGGDPSKQEPPEEPAAKNSELATVAEVPQETEKPAEAEVVSLAEVRQAREGRTPATDNPVIEYKTGQAAVAAVAA